MMQKQNRGTCSWFVCVCFLLAAFFTAIPYLGTLDAKFVSFDDDINIYENPNLGPVTPARLKWMFTDFQYMRRYLPLTWLSWCINYQISGKSPFGFHLGNVLLHGLNAGLVFLIVRKLIQHLAPEMNWKWSMAAALWAAFAWSLHPLRVEPVAWASGRLYCQALFFLLISFLLYLEAVIRPNINLKKYILLIFLSALCYVMSLISYPIALGYLAVLIAVDLWVFKRMGNFPSGLFHAPSRKVWIEKVWYFIAVAGVLGVTTFARFQEHELWEKPVSLEEFGIFPRIMQGFYVWAYYVWKPWVPVNLSPVYTDLISFNPNSAPFWASMALVVVLTIILLRPASNKILLAVWISYLGLLFPMLGFTEHPHFTNDRYSYIAGILWPLVLLMVLWKVKSKLKVGLFALISCLLLLMPVMGALASMSQTRIWKDSKTLYHYMISKLGAKTDQYDVFSRLAYVYYVEKDYPMALKYLDKTLRSNPGDFVSVHLMGRIYTELNNPEEATKWLLAAHELDPKAQDVVLSLGIAMARTGDQQMAEQYFRKAIELNPRERGGHYNLGVLLTKQGRTDEALESLAKAVEIDPDYEQARFQLAGMLASLGQTLEARHHLEELLKRNPAHGDAQEFLNELPHSELR